MPRVALLLTLLTLAPTVALSPPLRQRRRRAPPASLQPQQQRQHLRRFHSRPPRLQPWHLLSPTLLAVAQSLDELSASNAGEWLIESSVRDALAAVRRAAASQHRAASAAAPLCKAHGAAERVAIRAARRMERQAARTVAVMRDAIFRNAADADELRADARRMMTDVGDDDGGDEPAALLAAAVERQVSRDESEARVAAERARALNGYDEDVGEPPLRRALDPNATALALTDRVVLEQDAMRREQDAEEDVGQWRRRRRSGGDGGGEKAVWGALLRNMSDSAPRLLRMLPTTQGKAAAAAAADLRGKALASSEPLRRESAHAAAVLREARRSATSAAQALRAVDAPCAAAAAAAAALARELAEWSCTLALLLGGVEQLGAQGAEVRAVARAALATMLKRLRRGASCKESDEAPEAEG